jgi:hypothetical protein
MCSDNTTFTVCGAFVVEFMTLVKKSMSDQLNLKNDGLKVDQFDSIRHILCIDLHK